MSYPPGSDAAKFVTEIESAPDYYEIEHYEGRYFYEGPAVRVDDVDEFLRVIRATTVDLNWDTLGSGKIVFPRHGSKEV